MAKAKRESNPQRWSRLCSEGQAACEDLRNFYEENQEEIDRLMSAEKLTDKEKAQLDAYSKFWTDKTAIIEDAARELEDMRSDYADKYQNMPDSLQQTPYGEKCGAMDSLSIDDSAWSDDWDMDGITTMDDMFSECEGTEIPLGFGRD